MSFLEHLEELRVRLIVSLGALLAGFIVALFFIEKIVDFVYGPLTGALALRFRMRWAQLTATLRGLLLALFGTRLYRRMLAERRRLRAEFEALERSA